MEDTEQPSDSAKQAQHDEDIYELRLYVVGNNRKSQLAAFDNLKEICYKYLAGKCHIEVIDLTNNHGHCNEEALSKRISTRTQSLYRGKCELKDNFSLRLANLFGEHFKIWRSKHFSLPAFHIAIIHGLQKM